MLLKGSPSINAKVYFEGEASPSSSTDKQQAAFTGDDHIAGQVAFTLKKNYENVRYKILLKGIVSTTTGEGTASLQSSIRKESFTFISATLFDGGKTASPAESRFRASIPFRFTIRNDDAVAGDEVLQPSFLRQLLPSINSKSAPTHWSKSLVSSADAFAQYHVTYTLIASAFVDNKKVSSHVRQFQFTPITPKTAAIAVEDFPGEFTLRSSKVLQQGTSQARLGVVSDEPAALSISMKGDGSSTEVELMLMLCRETGDYFVARPPPRTCRVTANLRSTTFIMPRPAKPAFHTLEVASYNHDIAVREEKNHSQEHVVALEDWEGHDSGSEDEKATPFPEVCTTRGQFRFILDAKRLPVPTFHSPLLSRRYAIDLALTFDNDPASTMKLRLPVQIAYVN